MTEEEAREIAGTYQRVLNSFVDAMDAAGINSGAVRVTDAIVTLAVLQMLGDHYFEMLCENGHDPDDIQTMVGSILEKYELATDDIAHKELGVNMPEPEDAC